MMFEQLAKSNLFTYAHEFYILKSFGLQFLNVTKKKKI